MDFFSFDSNKKNLKNGESIEQTENTYMKAYETCLRSFPELHDYQYSGVALRDLDKNKMLFKENC